MVSRYTFMVFKYMVSILVTYIIYIYITWDVPPPGSMERPPTFPHPLAPGRTASNVARTAASTWWSGPKGGKGVANHRKLTFFSPTCGKGISSTQKCFLGKGWDMLVPPGRYQNFNFWEGFDCDMFPLSSLLMFDSYMFFLFVVCCCLGVVVTYFWQLPGQSHPCGPLPGCQWLGGGHTQGMTGYIRCSFYLYLYSAQIPHTSSSKAVEIFLAILPYMWDIHVDITGRLFEGGTATGWNPVSQTRSLRPVHVYI